MVIIFLILAIFIVISVIYATINFVANERAIKVAEIARKKTLEQTFLDISTTCNNINDAKNDNRKLKELAGELREAKRFLKKYY